MVWCDRLSSTTTDKVTSTLSKWFNDFGFPKSIRTDGGPQFRGPFDNWCKENCIVHELSSAYNPQSNGHAEAAVKVAKTLLSKLASDANMRQFSSHLFAWRNTPRTDGYSPASLFFGRRLRSALPCLSLPATDLESAQHARQEASVKVKARFDEHTRSLPSLSPGDAVLVQSPTSLKWEGEGIVVDKRRPDGLSYDVSVKHKDAPAPRNRKNLRPI